MHELAVTDSLLKMALRHAEDAGAPRVTDLYLVVGQMSSIVDDSVQFYWDILSKHTPAQGSQLHFRRVPTEMLCSDCGGRFSPSEEELACPNCSGVRVQIVAGQEFYLESIDVE